MLNAGNIAKAVNIVASGASLLQAGHLHKVGLDEEERLHQEELKLTREQFQIELQTARRTYLLSMYADMETYFQELNENLISSTRDAERDMVDQRNQQFQTILLAATIMLTAVLGVLFQGTLPSDISSAFYIGYSIACSMSLVCLMVNIALCILITTRVTRFMYRRSDANIRHLRHAMRHTKGLMRNLRGSSSGNHGLHESAHVDLPMAIPLRTLNAISGIPEASVLAPHSPAVSRRRISELSDTEIEEEWRAHEREVNKYLNHRARLAERLEALTVDDENAERMSFQMFWRLYCAGYAHSALVLFYFGTALMLVTTMVFVWVYFSNRYKSRPAAVVSVSTIGVSLVLCLGLAVFLRFFDSSIAVLNAQLARESTDDRVRYHQWIEQLFRGGRTRHTEYKIN